MRKSKKRTNKKSKRKKFLRKRLHLLRTPLSDTTPKLNHLN